MADLRKSLFVQDLDKYQVFVQDTDPNSKYFNITELPDTFTGGKNAFLVQGSQFLVPDTLVRIELKDAAGNTIYNEPGEGIVSSSVNGTPIVTEYYEGTSKVVAVYIYPDTAFGPCTLTILGELDSYDNNGLITPIPVEWQGAYNVKWQKQINVNPALANTTKIRFYRRPQATINEILSPIYRIESGSKYNSGVYQSFANIKLSQLETFAGDVKRVKVFRTSEGDISDYSLIQDILVESKELLTSYGLSGSVVGETGILTQETLQNYWNTGSLKADLTSSRVESGVKLSGSGYFTYTSSLDLKSANTYELNFDAFYSSSTASNLGVYLSYVSQSTTFTSSITTLEGITPTKNLLDTTIPFKLDRDYPSASLYFSQSIGEWHLGNISLKLSQDTAFSPDEVSFVTTMPTIIGNETYNFKFEFYDVNNNYVPVYVTQSANFTGGNLGQLLRTLQFTTDRTAFRFSSGSVGNPPFQQVGFSILKANLTGSVTYDRSVYDTLGNYISPASYAGTYPGQLTNASDAGATLTIANFSGSVRSVTVGSIVYTASCDGINEYETIYRFEDGDNAPGVFVTANTNQFIYKATDLSLNPTGQVITIEAKRKNLASATTALTVNSGSGKPALTVGSTNATTGVTTYTLAGSSYPYSTGETIYYISGSDQFGNEFSDSIKISPVKILDGFSVAVSNENTSFPAYSTGTVFGGFAASSGSITVKVGNEVISYASPIANNKFSASISAYSTGLTPNTFDGVNYSINALSVDSGSLTLLVKYQDGGGTIISASKEITYSKAKVGTPNIVVAVSPTSQTLVTNSRGSGSATPTTLTVTALEGGTSRFISIGTPTYTNGLAGSVSGNTIIFSSNASSIYADTAQVTIPVNYQDSEGTSGTKNIVANISKAKTAAPTTLATLSSETQTILSSSVGYATPATFTISVNEGGSNYSYDVSLASNSTYYVSSITGGTNSSGTITPTTPSSTSGTTVSITISYKNSEGTTGTITKTHKVAVSLEGTKGTNGTNGANGADGGAGPGVVYRGDWAPNTIYYSSSIRVDVVKGSDGGYYYAKTGHTSTNTSPYTDKPITGATYTTYWNSFGATFSSVATDILLAQDATITRGLVMGTYGATDKGFIRSANATALNSGKGYYLDTTGSMRFGDPSGAYIRFTESDGVRIAGNAVIEGTVTIGGSSATTVKDGAALGATAQQNNSAKTDGSVGGWTISSTAIYRGTVGADDTFTTNAGDITLGAGWISSKQFKISSTGDATFAGSLSAAGGTFAGNLSAAGGTFSGNLSAAGGTFAGQVTVSGTDYNLTDVLNSNTTKAQVGLGNVSNLTPQNQAETGLIAGTTITGGGITLSNGGSIKGGQTDFNTGTGFFLGYSSGYKFSIGNSSDNYLTWNGAVLQIGGEITANSGLIGGWTIGGNKIYKTNKLELDAGATYPAINVYGSDNVPRVIINNSPSLSSLTGGGAGSGTTTSENLGNSNTGTQKYGTAISMATVAGATYSLTITFTESDSNNACNFSPGASSGNITTRIDIWNTALSTQYGNIWYDVSDTISNQTYWTWSLLGGINGRTVTTSVTGDGTTLKIRPGILYGGSTFTARALTFPSFTYSWSQTVSKTEIIPGGMQVVNSTAAYLKADRTVTDSAGTPWMTSAGNWSHNGTLITTSDRNIKNNIVPIEFDLTKLNEIDGYSYNKEIDYDEDGNPDTIISTYGVIAQEIENILPNAVSTNSNTGIKGVDYNAVTGMLVSGLKQLYKKVVELENKISGSI